MTELKNIFAEGTSKTPQIDFNRFTGELILYGRSIPENAAKVYEPLLSWVNNYIKSPRPVTNLRLNLEYFNTASMLWVTKIIKELSKIKVHDYILFIHVYFDIDEFDNMDIEELKDIVGSLVDNIGNASISIGVKTYGTKANGEVVREAMVLI
jgi:hypothetical protein